MEMKIKNTLALEQQQWQKRKLGPGGPDISEGSQQNKLKQNKEESQDT